MEEIELFREWLEASGKSPHTITSYVSTLERFLEFIDKPADQVTAQDVMKWYKYLKGKVVDGKSSPRKYSLRSIALYAWALRNFYKSLGKYDLANSIPILDYEIEEANWLEEYKIYDLINNTPFPFKAVISTSYELALRLGEVGLLKINDFNPDEMKMTVHRLKRRKSRSEENLPMVDWSCKILSAYLSKRVEYYGHDPMNKLFPISRETIQYQYRKHAELRGIEIENYTFHVLRHSRLTHMAIHMLRDQGRISAFRLMTFAGHSQISTTANYVHLAADHLNIDLSTVEGWEDMEKFEKRSEPRYKGA